MTKVVIYPKDEAIHTNVRFEEKVTIVTVDASIPLGEGEYTYAYSQGKAKCHPDDTYNERVGEALATARAMENLWRKVEKQIQAYTTRPHGHTHYCIKTHRFSLDWLDKLEAHL